MNEFKLEHCPFCGSDAFLETMKVRKGYEADIHCNGCSANIQTVTFDFEKDAVHEAIKSWNRRTTKEERVLCKECRLCIPILNYLFCEVDQEEKLPDETCDRKIKNKRRRVDL